MSGKSAMSYLWCTLGSTRRLFITRQLYMRKMSRMVVTEILIGPVERNAQLILSRKWRKMLQKKIKLEPQTCHADKQINLACYQRRNIRLVSSWIIFQFRRAGKRSVVGRPFGEGTNNCVVNENLVNILGIINFLSIMLLETVFMVINTRLSK